MVVVDSVSLPVVLVASGEFHTCAVLDDTRVKCWGNGLQVPLGYGDFLTRGENPEEMGDNLPFVDLGTEAFIIDITANAAHTCVLESGGVVKCWGSSVVGLLGLGDVENRGSGPGEMGDNLLPVDLGRPVSRISAGPTHTCAVLDNGDVKCWGDAANGKLGQGVESAILGPIGDEPGEMGNNLSAVDLGVGRSATQISAGGDHTCAVLDDQTVKCWGLGSSGQLGYGDLSSRGSSPGEMGDNLPAVDLGGAAIGICTGDDHTCAILSDSTVKCWGSAASGQLGYGDTFDRGFQPGQMGSNLPTVDLGTGRQPLDITCGDEHTCVLLDDTTVKCWGSGLNGRLGYGDTNSRGDEPLEMGDNLNPVDLGTGRTAMRISAGAQYTCAILDDQSLKCWGLGINHQLGYGNNRTRGELPGQMGDNLPTVQLGTNATRFPTLSPSESPSPFPTASPSLLPTDSPSSTPNPSASPQADAPTSEPVDAIVIGGSVAAAVAVVLAAALCFATHYRTRDLQSRNTEETPQTALNVKYVPQE